MQHWLTKFIKGFGYAGRGISVAFKERNMRVHGLALLVVVIAGVYFHLAIWEWVAIVLVSAAVMSAEIVNTALEDICNTLRDTLGVSYTGTKVARDLAAGAVLILAIAAALVGAIIFGPKILAVI